MTTSAHPFKQISDHFKAVLDQREAKAMAVSSQLNASLADTKPHPDTLITLEVGDDCYDLLRKLRKVVRLGVEERPVPPLIYADVSALLAEKECLPIACPLEEIETDDGRRVAWRAKLASGIRRDKVNGKYHTVVQYEID